MDKDELRKKAEEIEKVYNEYKAKVNELKKERNGIINELVAELEKAKIEKIMNKLKN
jgi:hypothetical protein